MQRLTVYWVCLRVIAVVLRSSLSVLVCVCVWSACVARYSNTQVKRSFTLILICCHDSVCPLYVVRRISTVHSTQTGTYYVQWSTSCGCRLIVWETGGDWCIGDAKRQRCWCTIETTLICSQFALHQHPTSIPLNRSSSHYCIAVKLPPLLWCLSNVAEKLRDA